MISACGVTGYTPTEQEMSQTMGASQYQPRTQLERDAVETQDLFAQAAFWSREYDLNPGDLEAAMKLSSTLRKMGNATQALEIAKTARALYPRDTNLTAEYAAGLVALERGQDAISSLSGAVRQDPQNARLWSLLGASHDQIGQFAKGREYYGRALAIAPDDSNILANVGLSYALEGDARTAEIWLRRAAKNPDAGPAVRQNLALVLGLQGKYDEAESLAREDLNAAGAENNLAYLRSLRGGGRTYEALEQPQTQSISPQRTQPAPQALIQPRVPNPSMARPQTAQSYPRTTAPARTYGAPQRPGQSLLPPTRPNVSVEGGAREAAMAAARRMQAQGGAKRTIPLPAAQAAQQRDVLSKIGQANAPKSAPARPTYAQMQARAQQATQAAQQNAIAANQAQANLAARRKAQMQNQMQNAAQPQAAPQYGQAPYPGQYQSQAPYAGQPRYGAPQGYRQPARRRE